ncbi:5'-nucleotidase C-terminal domain-containing protein, partial [Klebsiella pneumoniae]|nr:5'-nucleotidase C-terminal domain-containing protein [Klebsiella pneumoniae]
NPETGEMLLDENGMPLFEASGGFLHISGANVFYDPTLPVEERVLLIGILNPETGEYDALDLEKTYYLATNDFLAAGGDGYTMLGGAREEGPSMDSVFAEYLKTADLSAYEVVNPYSRIIPVNSSIDTDEDGYPDFIEILLDTDPENPASNPETVPAENTDSPSNQVQNTSATDKKAPVDSPKVGDKKTEVASPAKTTKAGVLPNTGDQMNLTLSLFGLGLAGLAVAVGRRKEN